MNLCRDPDYNLNHNMAPVSWPLQGLPPHSIGSEGLPNGSSLETWTGNMHDAKPLVQKACLNQNHPSTLIEIPSATEYAAQDLQWWHIGWATNCSVVNYSLLFTGPFKQRSNSKARKLVGAVLSSLCTWSGKVCSVERR